MEKLKVGDTVFQIFHQAKFEKKSADNKKAWNITKRDIEVILRRNVICLQKYSVCVLIGLNLLDVSWSHLLACYTNFWKCLGYFSCFFCHLLIFFFFKINFFKKILSRSLVSECQTVWIKTKTDFLSVLIWVQTVCTAYQQMTIKAASKDRVKNVTAIFFWEEMTKIP